MRFQDICNVSGPQICLESAKLLSAPRAWRLSDCARPNPVSSRSRVPIWPSGDTSIGSWGAPRSTAPRSSKSACGGCFREPWSGAARSRASRRGTSTATAAASIDDEPWWDEPGLPRIEVDREGWVDHANPTALSLLGIAATDRGPRHYTDFVAPGGLEDARSLFEVVDEGHQLTATTLLRPTSGEVVAIDLHAWREGDRLCGVFRLADDVEITVPTPTLRSPASVACVPDTDAAFRGYVDREPSSGCLNRHRTASRSACAGSIHMPT